MNEEMSTIRCPRCGARIERPCPDGQTVPGSPLQKCPDCGRLYFDEAYEEAALTAYEAASINFPYIKILYALIPTAGALVYLRSYLRDPRSEYLIVLIAFGALAVFFDVLLIAAIAKAIRQSGRKKAFLDAIEGRAGELSAELRESMERLSGKDYLDALYKCRTYIPKYFYRRIGAEPPKRQRK